MATHEALDYFSARLDVRGPQPPRVRYVIFSSQRTGSNYLCARLCNASGRFGVPMEYLHGRAIATLRRRLLPAHQELLDLESYLAAVARVRTTPDGWFGVKIQPNQLAPLIGDDPVPTAALLSGFDKLVFMRREDKLAQAVSCAIARATGVWFNYGEEPSLDAGQIESVLDEIHADRQRFAREDRLMREIAHTLPPGRCIDWSFETLVSDPQRVVADTFAHLGAAAHEPIAEDDRVRPTQRPPGRLAARLRAAYLARYPMDGAATTAQSTRYG